MAKFVPRQRKQKALRRQQEQINHIFPDQSPVSNGTDSNALELLPRSTRDDAEKAERKAAMAAKLRESMPSKVSSKKKKRLDKYIDKKLQKEENVDLIKKLARHRVDTALLRSSRNLGATKLSKRETLAQALNETRAGIQSARNHELLFENPSFASNVNSTSESDSDSGTSTNSLVNGNGGSKSKVPDQPYDDSTDAKIVPPAIGSGLKRPLECDQRGIPITRKRKRAPTVIFPSRASRNLVLQEFDPQSESEASSWLGFSENGSSEDLGSDDSVSSDEDSSSIDEADVDGHFSDHVDPDELHNNHRTKERSSAFKAWATSRVNEALGFVPSGKADMNGDHEDDQHADDNAGISMAQHQNIKAKFKPRGDESEPLPPELVIPSTQIERKVFGMAVDRDPSIQEARLQLPILAEEQRLMEAIHGNRCVVVAGETGSGKTTQLPQFLYEAGYGQPDGPYSGMIGVTQPRRVAAMSMSARVAAELGPTHGRRVAHQIRFDSTVKAETAIKFMTDGILLREIAQDFILSRYSAIIIDEAHERSINTDILIGLMSRIVDLRATMSKEDEKIKPLKLVIMSATLRVQDFLSNKTLFRNGPPPLVQVQGRQYPVTTHFSRKTEIAYLEQARKRICRGHASLPPGGMLVFLTAQDEIMQLKNELEAKLFKPDDSGLSGTENSTHEDYDDVNSSPSSNDEDEDGDEDQDQDEKEGFDIGDTVDGTGIKTPRVRILPLFAQLSSVDQLRVFEPVPADTRLIVLATNVAETSLTIPGIRYVFDSGRSKEKKYNQVTGVQSFEIGWISKAGASQRAGRAGRTGPGHCYRLYSSAVYERDFKEHAEPEIVRMPVEDVVLQLKSMDLHNVVNFPFPSPPDRHSLLKAERLLQVLGALSKDGRITPLGRKLSDYPVSPRFAKILEIGHQYNCMNFTILLVAALTTPTLFTSPNLFHLETKREHGDNADDETALNMARQQRQSDFNHAQHLMSRLSKSSDALKAFTAMQAYLKVDQRQDWCERMFVAPRAAQEAENLYRQLASIIANKDPLRMSAATKVGTTPSKNQVAALQQFAAAGFLDQIAILASESPAPPYLGQPPKRAIDVPYLPLLPLSSDAVNRAQSQDIRTLAVFIHPSSLLARMPVTSLPKYVIYSHLQQGSTSLLNDAKIAKTRMHAITPLDDRALGILARGTPLIGYGKPVGKIEETLGSGGKSRVCHVSVDFRGNQAASMTWSLPVQKVVQIRDARGEWIVDDVID